MKTKTKLCLISSSHSLRKNMIRVALIETKSSEQRDSFRISIFIHRTGDLQVFRISIDALWSNFMRMFLDLKTCFLILTIPCQQMTSSREFWIERQRYLNRKQKRFMKLLQASTEKMFSRLAHVRV